MRFMWKYNITHEIQYTVSMLNQYGLQKFITQFWIHDLELN